MLKYKKSLWLLVVLFLTACSSLTTTSIDIRNDEIVHEGFDFNISSLRHKFALTMKASETIAIEQIDYSIKIEGTNKRMEGSFEFDKSIVLSPNSGFKQFSLLGEPVSYLDVCEQLQTLFRANSEASSLTMDLELITSDHRKFVINDVNIRFKNDSIIDQIRNYLAEKGCNIIELVKFLKVILGV